MKWWYTIVALLLNSLMKTIKMVKYLILFTFFNKVSDILELVLIQFLFIHVVVCTYSLNGFCRNLEILRLGTWIKKSVFLKNYHFEEFNFSWKSNFFLIWDTRSQTFKINFCFKTFHFTFRKALVDDSQLQYSRSFNNSWFIQCSSLVLYFLRFSFELKFRFFIGTLSKSVLPTEK